MHKKDIMQWLKKRNVVINEKSKIKKNYLIYPDELIEEFRIKKIFTVFDEDL